MHTSPKLKEIGSERLLSQDFHSAIQGPRWADAFLECGEGGRKPEGGENGVEEDGPVGGAAQGVGVRIWPLGCGRVLQLAGADLMSPLGPARDYHTARGNIPLAPW